MAVRMDWALLAPDLQKATEDVLGYLNFGSGTADPRLLVNLNQLFEAAAQEPPAYAAVGLLLQNGLRALQGKKEAFRDAAQAQSALQLTFDSVLPGYRRFHHDLLHHQTDAALFTPFFVGRVFEVVLRQGPPWSEVERIVAAAVKSLNDYIGYRPVAVLRTAQKIQPYEHEWVAAIPLFLRGVGSSAGKYQQIIDRALSLLETTDADLLFAAHFDPEWLDEVAMDPRAYDFEHPNNRRPNYLYGQWDLMRLDNAGRSRRFVLQQVALDLILKRVEEAAASERDELLTESAGVLAGTILMGSGISGNRPDAHDSTVSLATLVQRIALYRDNFYTRLIDRIRGPHGARLREEAAAARQPFGGARQDFNQRVARRRAAQFQNVTLTRLFMRMGNESAAREQVARVPAVSARMTCEIHSGLMAAQRALDDGRLEEVAAQLPQVEDRLQRAIGCGAVVDPWNILGFGGQYSLFPAAEDSVPDPRVEDLIGIVTAVFGIYSDLWTQAAARGLDTLETTAADGLRRVAAWWDRFAADEISGVDGISGRETVEAAEHVARALGQWHRAGTASGDIAFWRGHAEEFRSPKSYASVVAALLGQQDHVAAMALLMQWLSQHHEIDLVEEEHTFHDLALQWLEAVWEPWLRYNGVEPAAEKTGKRTKGATAAKTDSAAPSAGAAGAAGKPDAAGETAAAERPPARESLAAAPRALGPAAPAIDRWALTRKFIDYLEANAEDLWNVPSFELQGENRDDTPAETAAAAELDDDGPADEEDETFGAAYENMTFQGTSDDGFEGEVFDVGQSAGELELTLESERLTARLVFIATLAEMWRFAAVASRVEAAGSADRRTTLAAWLTQAEDNHRRLSELLVAVHRYRIPAPRGTFESRVEYDRRRTMKEALLEQIIETCVETADAALMIAASMDEEQFTGNAPTLKAVVVRCLGAMMRGDVKKVRQWWVELVPMLIDQPMLYVAIGRGGHPTRVAESRGLQRVIKRLLYGLPRLGLLRETDDLICLVHDMEVVHPVGPGGITEFDDVFEIGCRGICECLAASSEKWRKTRTQHPDHQLIGLLEIAVEALLERWLDHSLSMRLSVAESLRDSSRFAAVKKFIEQYGGDLFTQQFMQISNLRAILHEGVERWLESLAEEPEAEEAAALRADLDQSSLPRDKALRLLSLILESVVDYYPIYVDYNTTTTQSDRGEMLFALLDFLRLAASYDRVAWNLRPVVIAHDVLVRSGRSEAATLWREAIAARTATAAEDHLKKLQRLTRRYGMRLASIAERLGERFVGPMEVDRLRALARLAIDELHKQPQSEAFERLRAEIERLQQEPTSLAVEVPVWLGALLDESNETDDADVLLASEWHFPVPRVRLLLGETRKELNGMFNQP